MDSNGNDVLLVDDSRDDVELVCFVLRAEKLVSNVQIARDGEEALDFLFCRGRFAARSFNHPPKIVLLDLKLPKVNGLEVLEQLKNDLRTKIIPVVILSSSNEERDLVRSYQLGANSYIQKPMDYEKLRHTVKTAVIYWLSVNHTLSPKHVGNHEDFASNSAVGLKPISLSE